MARNGSSMWVWCLVQVLVSSWNTEHWSISIKSAYLFSNSSWFHKMSKNHLYLAIGIISCGITSLGVFLFNFWVVLHFNSRALSSCCFFSVFRIIIEYSCCFLSCAYQVFVFFPFLNPYKFCHSLVFSWMSSLLVVLLLHFLFLALV